MIQRLFFLYINSCVDFLIMEVAFSTTHEKTFGKKSSMLEKKFITISIYEYIDYKYSGYPSCQVFQLYDSLTSNSFYAY